MSDTPDYKAIYSQHSLDELNGIYEQLHDGNGDFIGSAEQLAALMDAINVKSIMAAETVGDKMPTSFGVGQATASQLLDAPLSAVKPWKERVIVGDKSHEIG